VRGIRRIKFSAIAKVLGRDPVELFAEVVEVRPKNVKI
jgi:hypothetical protein